MQMQSKEVGQGSRIMPKRRGNSEWSSDPKWLLVTRMDWQTRSGFHRLLRTLKQTLYKASQPNEATCGLLLAALDTGVKAASSEAMREAASTLDKAEAARGPLACFEARPQDEHQKKQLSLTAHPTVSGNSMPAAVHWAPAHS